jgi:hypothetical protein
MKQLRRIEGERGLDKIFAESGKGGVWAFKPLFGLSGELAG